MGSQALKPSKFRENALLIQVALDDPDHIESLSISSTRIVPRDFINDPIVNSDIAGRQERCQINGGSGTYLVIVQYGTISQVVPFEDLDDEVCHDNEEGDDHEDRHGGDHCDEG